MLFTYVVVSLIQLLSETSTRLFWVQSFLHATYRLNWPFLNSSFYVQWNETSCTDKRTHFSSAWTIAWNHKYQKTLQIKESSYTFLVITVCHNNGNNWPLQQYYSVQVNFNSKGIRFKRFGYELTSWLFCNCSKVETKLVCVITLTFSYLIFCTQKFNLWILFILRIRIPPF